MRTNNTRKHPKTYRSYEAMRSRCNNPNNVRYHRYGGRGIKVCDKWKSFDDFFRDMGTRPEKKTLDRIDNDKGYSAENCRWATYAEQYLTRSSGKDGVSKHRGVSKAPNKCKYRFQSHLSFKGKRYWIGESDNEDELARKYNIKLASLMD